jgi:hypothetical protein
MAHRSYAERGLRIESSMRLLRRLRLILPLVLSSCLTLSAGTPGSFRGTIVAAPSAGSGEHWIYVQGRNGTARRVDISGARITYDEDVPPAQRRHNPAEALTEGAEVRVTAEGSDGEWKASRIEILRPAVKTEQSAAPESHRITVSRL